MMKKSIEELKKLANKGVVKAQYELGMELISETETYWEGMDWLYLAAEQGHELSQQAIEDETTDDDGRFDAWA